MAKFSGDRDASFLMFWHDGNLITTNKVYAGSEDCTICQRPVKWQLYKIKGKYQVYCTRFRRRYNCDVKSVVPCKYKLKNIDNADDINLPGFKQITSCNQKYNLFTRQDDKAAIVQKYYAIFKSEEGNLVMVDETGELCITI